MRRKISLYIGGKPVDLDDQSFVLFNYSYEDLDNPTIVKNSFSQQITLKGTPANNIVFNDAFRLDRVSGAGFNPRVKTPFAIYDEMNNLIESGYVKLDSVSNKRNTTEYKVTLYGGLGSFLYSLSYDDNGDKMSLADLDFLGSATPATEFNYTINRNLVANAWDRLNGQSTITAFDVINFAPCYEGLPDDFSADKAVIDGSVVSVFNGGTVVANLAKEYTGTEAHDFRSYLLRPVVRFKSIIEAIARFATANGYTFTVDQNWTDEQNPYYNSVWLTLPLLSGKRTGDAITKTDLMSGTDTPADYLLSYCKTFGLKLVCNDKNITILTRNSFFINSTTDLSSRIDVSGVEMTPIIFSSKWYEMKNDVVGAFADYYSDKYGVTYGMKRIDTGFAFDSSVNQIAESIVFKSAVQSNESNATNRKSYRDTGTEQYGIVDFPSMFFDGGTYSIVSGSETSEHALLSGQLTFAWWDTTNYGFDATDMMQFHDSDKKSIDGKNVLTFFAGMDDRTGHQLVLSDDTTDMIDKPCWNLSSVNTRTLTAVPHFSRHIVESSSIVRSLDFGDSRELNVPGVTYGTSCGIYDRQWASYIGDRFDEDTKKVNVKVDFTGIQVNADLLRRFYWFGGTLWMLNAITNYSMTTFDAVECEFIQVQNISNYTNGQSE